MEEENRLQLILHLFRKIGGSYGQELTRVAGELGMARPEADVLCFLHNNPSLNTARDIVAYRGFSKTYVSRAVEKLVARGYLAAEYGEEDRRVQALEILPAAGEAVRQLSAAQKRFAAAFLSCLSREDREAFHRIIDQLERNFNQ